MFFTMDQLSACVLANVVTGSKSDDKSGPTTVLPLLLLFSADEHDNSVVVSVEDLLNAMVCCSFVSSMSSIMLTIC